MSFRESFTREQRKTLLQYDDNAFLFFLITVIICILIPWSIYFIWSSLFPNDKHLRRLDSQNRKKVLCDCQICYNDFQTQKIQLYAWRKRFSFSRMIQLVVILILFSFISYCMKNITSDASIQRFDPYEILGVQKDATEREIRKAFRVLSLIHHPDKNPNDPSSAARFILMNKALKTLIDETAKRNMELYGNPDGQGTMEIGIGLPKFLVDEENQTICLIFILTVFLLVIPLLFITRYQKQKLYYSNGVYIETIHFIAYFISERTSFDNLIEFLAVSAEAREFDIKEQNESFFNKIESKIAALNEEYDQELNIHRIYLLLQAHTNGMHDVLSSLMLIDLQSFLKLSFPILDCITEIAILHSWLNIVETSLSLTRCLLHGVSPQCDAYKQIFDSDYEIIKHKLPENFRDFTYISREQLEELIVDFEEHRKNDLVNIFRSIPKRSMTVNFSVIGEDNIIEEDVVTITIKIQQDHIKEDFVTGPVHSRFLPNFHYEKLWIIIKNSLTGLILMHKYITPLLHIHTEEMKFLAPKPGSYTFEIRLYSDSFFDIDIIKNYSFTVQQQDKAQRVISVHKKDMELGTEQSMFSQFLRQEDNEKQEFSDSDSQAE